MKSQKMIVIESSDEEEDAEFMEEQKNFLQAQYQKQLDEKNKFDNLCDGKMAYWRCFSSRTWIGN